MPEMEAVIGLEIHVELQTKTKIFCGCRTAFGATPNTQVCPICLGLPGHKPRLNKKALEYHLRAALALNCEVAPYVAFDRKNYFYADLPKGYQISQYFHPLGVNGFIDLSTGKENHRVRVSQIHLEEDTGKLLHLGEITSSPYSLVDFNRAGVPLLEIVTAPDIPSADEARLFLQKLRSLILYTGVSDCKMEEGSMRCDANISVRPKGSKEFGEKTELKNMNSFRSVARGIEYEVARQTKLVLADKQVIPQTRHWDETQGITKAMRTKYLSTDYRCLPDPNIPPIECSPELIEKIREALPEMPEARLNRFIQEYGLPEYDAEIITNSRAMADFFEQTLALIAKPKVISNWLMGEVSRCLNEDAKEIDETELNPELLAKLIKLIDEGVISNKIAKDVFVEMYGKGLNPEEIVKNKGLVQIADTDTLSSLITQVIEENPKVVEDYRQGKDKALGFLVGQVMKASKGKANPQLVNKMLQDILNT